MGYEDLNTMAKEVSLLEEETRNNGIEYNALRKEKEAYFKRLKAEKNSDIKKTIVADIDRVDEMAKKAGCLWRSSYKKLQDLKRNYFYTYFGVKREPNAWLTNIPNPKDYISVMPFWHPLYTYSFLNVEAVASMICLLFKDYENKEMVSKRIIKEEIHYENRSKINPKISYCDYTPEVIIGEVKNIYDDHNKDNIVIRNGDRHTCLEKPYEGDYSQLFLNEKPYYWYMLGFSGELSFNDKGHQFIRELIYSLAYYQMVNDKHLTSSKETMKAFEKIYAKKRDTR